MVPLKNYDFLLLIPVKAAIGKPTVQMAHAAQSVMSAESMNFSGGFGRPAKTDFFTALFIGVHIFLTI